MILEHSQVILEDDVPAKGLVAGEVGTVVSVLGGGKAYTVEFMTMSGRTIAVATLDDSQVSLLSGEEIPQPNQLVAA